MQTYNIFIYLYASFQIGFDCEVFTILTISFLLIVTSTVH